MKLFLDDERVPIESGWTIAKNSEQFSQLIEHNYASITTISFDHDLGSASESGMWCLRFLVEQMMDGTQFENLEEIIFHSANLTGCENMLTYAENAAEHVPAITGVTLSIQSSLNTIGHAKMPDDFDWALRVDWDNRN